MDFCTQSCTRESIAKLAEKWRSGLAECADLETAAELAREETDGDIVEQVVTGSYTGCDFSGLNFNRVLFWNCEFQDCDFSRASFLDSLFRQVKLTGVRLHTAFCSNVCLIDCKAVGAQLPRSRLLKVRFSGCNFQYADFTGCRLAKSVLENSNFSEAAFPEAQLLELTLRDSRFLKTSFFRTPLAGIDFTACDIGGFTLSEHAPELRRAIVTPAQAAELAKLLGLIVETA